MLLGCLEQTKLMVLFAKHELYSERKIWAVPRRWAKTAVFSYTGRINAASGMIELRWLLRSRRDSIIPSLLGYDIMTKVRR